METSAKTAMHVNDIFLAIGMLSITVIHCFSEADRMLYFLSHFRGPSFRVTPELFQFLISYSYADRKQLSRLALSNQKLSFVSRFWEVSRKWQRQHKKLKDKLDVNLYFVLNRLEIVHTSRKGFYKTKTMF